MNATAKYILLLTQYINGNITASQFEAAYLDMFKAEASKLQEDVYEVLNNLFLDVDSYCSDPVLRDDEDLDDEGLLSSAKEALTKLT